MSRTNSEMVKEFMKRFNQQTGRNIFSDDVEILKLLAMRVDLIAEEYDELKTATDRFAQALIQTGVLPAECFLDVVDSLVDILYVTYGFFHAFGIDGETAFKIVHRSNMTKVGIDGKPVFRADGKVLKGENYIPPDLTPVLDSYIEELGSMIRLTDA